MSDPDSEGAQGGKSSDCIAELSLLLDKTLRDAGTAEEPTSSLQYSCLLCDPPLYVFSTPLLNALLTKTSTSFSNLNQLLPFIDLEKDRIVRALETVSVRCLAYYLLRSDVEAAIECGLCLLLNEPEYIKDSGSMRFQLSVPKSGHSLQLARKGLVQKACQIFTNATVHARVRRMTGRLLVEMMHDSEDCRRLLKEQNKRNPLEPIFTTLNDPDIVISFFAGAVIRTLHQLGTRERLNSDLNRTHSEILNHIQSEGNVVERFYSYVLAKSQHISSEIEDEYRLNITNGDLPACYLLDSDGTATNELPHSHVLLVFGMDGLDFLYFEKDTTDRKLNYMTLHPTKRTRTTCILTGYGAGKKPRLTMHPHAADSLMVNGQTRSLQGVSLSMTSGDDLINIQKRLEAIGIQCRKQNSRNETDTRRSSSLMMPLDMADEVARKSSQLFETPPGTVIKQAAHCDHWRTKASNLIGGLDCISETATENPSQSSLTDLTRTPTYGTSSPKRRSSSYPVSPEVFTKSQRTDKEKAFCAFNSSTDLLRKNGAQNREETKQQNEPQISQSGPARNTRSKSSQNRKLKSILPNTQESLIFPRRRSRGKGYTFPSKTVVDWAEELQTSDGFVEQELRTDTELTPVFSPLPNGTDCALYQRDAKRAEVSTRRKSVTKARRQPKISGKGRGKRFINGKAKPSLPLTETFGNQKGSHIDLPGSIQEQKAEVNLGASRSSSRLKKSHTPNFSSNDPSIVKPAHKTSKAGLPSEQDGRVENTMIAKVARDLLETDIPASSNTGLNRSDYDQYAGEKQQGRGQTVAQKLIAALRVSSSPDRPNEAQEKHLDEAEHGTEPVHEATDLGKLPVHNSQCTGSDFPEGDDSQEVSWFSEPNMSQKDITINEPVSSHVGSRRTPLQDNAHDNCNQSFQEGANALEAENKQERNVIWRSSLVTGSLVEPRTDSSFEYCHTSFRPQSRENYHASDKHPENIASFSEDNHTGEASDGVSSEEGDGVDCVITRKSPEEGIKGNVDGVTKCLESSTRTIVDKNGSPRLLQQGRNDHVTPKRLPTSLNAEQELSTKRRKLSHQVDHGDAAIILRTTGEDLMQDDCAVTGCITTESRLKEPPRLAFNRAIKRSSRLFSASHTEGPRNEKISPFLSRLRATIGERRLLKTTSTASSTTAREPCPVAETKDHDLKSQGSSTNKLPSHVAGLELTVALKQAKRATSEIDWQTSLRELQQGMQNTLLSNSEHLSRQIESEKKTVNKVLDAYREQCHGVLDQLFEAQRERIRLCKQQMDSIKQQHADVCQELICRLEENERSLKAVQGSQ